YARISCWICSTLCDCRGIVSGAGGQLFELVVGCRQCDSALGIKDGIHILPEILLIRLRSAIGILCRLASPRMQRRRQRGLLEDKTYLGKITLQLFDDRLRGFAVRTL